MAGAPNGTRAEQFREGDSVVAATAMPGIPEGTKGKVTLVEGLSWIRYWVRFQNGVQRGSLHRQKLARPDEWAELQYRRAHGITDDEGDAEEAAEEGGEEAAAASSGDDKVVGGAVVPGHLLERTKKRLEDLGVTR